ncbi:MAG: hypothetical protein M9921_10300 [Fimbriimonadaceae bacterium]|nr:hypothetical protein [Chthonomonadaceae bacterium]MCO5297236.1 hypothetical protein [Fimbriimonadaceae bacterium]
MNYRDQMIRLTQGAADHFVHSIKAMPAEKLEWSVNDAGRTAMDQFREIAQSPMWAVPLLKARSFPPFDPEVMAKAKEERDQWDLATCETRYRENLEALYAEIRALPDDELAIEIVLPFAGGITQSMADIMAYPYWNTVYHLGQINFIQILYGDHEMR